MKLLQLYYYERLARNDTGKPSSITLPSIDHGFQGTAAPQCLWLLWPPLLAHPLSVKLPVATSKVYMLLKERDVHILKVFCI